MFTECESVTTKPLLTLAGRAAVAAGPMEKDLRAVFERLDYWDDGYVDG